MGEWSLSVRERQRRKKKIKRMRKRKKYDKYLLFRFRGENVDIHVFHTESAYAIYYVSKLSTFLLLNVFRYAITKGLNTF